MSAPTTPVISQLQTLLPEFRERLKAPSLEICLAPEWGSANKDARPLLRRAMVTELSKHVLLSDIDQVTLLQLECVPQPALSSVSISHTQTIGGFAFTNKQSPVVGFDIELTARLRPKAVERVSQPGELEAAPSAGHLWTAKEAAFKSMRGPKQPPILSSLRASAWHSVTKRENFRLWSCEIHENSQPEATTEVLTVELSGITLSISVHQP